MCSEIARREVKDDGATNEELAYLAKIAIKMDKRNRQTNGKRTALQLSQNIKSRRNWFACFLLTNAYEMNVSNWYKPEDLFAQYNKHMGVVKITETETLSDKHDTFDSSLEQYHLNRGLNLLSKEIKMENQIRKKNIRKRSKSQHIQFNGFPSAWKFPEELTGVQNIVSNKLAFERLKRVLDSAGVLRPYLLSVALSIIDSMKLSVSENLSVNDMLSFYYATIPESVSNKPSKEEYGRYLTAFSESLNRLNEEQTKTLAESLVSLMMNSHFIMRMVLLYALSEI